MNIDIIWWIISILLAFSAGGVVATRKPKDPTRRTFTTVTFSRDGLVHLIDNETSQGFLLGCAYGYKWPGKSPKQLFFSWEELEDIEEPAKSYVKMKLLQEEGERELEHELNTTSTS